MVCKDEVTEAVGKIQMERRIIHVEYLPDQAGIAAALRRAFAAGPLRDEDDADGLFDDLLRQLH